MGVSDGWTLLEFANATRERKTIDKATVPPQTAPPEVSSSLMVMLYSISINVLARFPSFQHLFTL